MFYKKQIFHKKMRIKTIYYLNESWTNLKKNYICNLKFGEVAQLVTCLPAGRERIGNNQEISQLKMFF
jgi:hypothetical protein